MADARTVVTQSHRHHVPWSSDAVRGPFADCVTKRYEPGRICAYPGCKTVLSSYNSTSFCSVHEGRVERSPEKRQHKRAVLLPDGRKVCTKCGKAFPDTADYFFRRYDKGREGLRQECKSCCVERDRQNKIRAWRRRTERRSHA